MRVTNKDLEKLCQSINRLTGNPEDPTSMVGGKMVFNVGCYHPEISYGRVRVLQIVSETGGQRTVMFTNTRESIYYQLIAMIEGIHVARGERV